MSKVFFLNTNKSWGGGEKWHLSTAIYLQEHGIKPHIICYPNSVLAQKAKERKILVTELKISKLSFLNPYKRKKLRDLLIFSDKIIMNLPQDFKIGTIVAHSLNYKRIIYRRGMPHPVKNNFINKMLFPKLTHIIANSLEIKESLLSKSEDWFPEKKILTIYNGIHLKDFPNTEKNFSKDIFQIGCVARLTKQKALNEAVEVARILAQNNFPFRLSIAGVGEEKENLITLIKAYKLEDKVELLGHVENIAEHMKGLDYFLFPSHFEGSPNTLIEAMASKLICFAYDVSSMPEIIDNQINGYLVKKGDTKALASKIMSHKSSEMPERAYDKVKMYFNYEQNMKVFLKIIS